MDPTKHRYMGALMVLCSCKIMMYTIARDPDIAIFVEMMSNIQKSLLKFGLGFVWLFVGEALVRATYQDH